MKSSVLSLLALWLFAASAVAQSCPAGYVAAHIDNGDLGSAWTHPSGLIVGHDGSARNLATGTNSCGVAFNGSRVRLGSSNSNTVSETVTFSATHADIVGLEIQGMGGWNAGFDRLEAITPAPATYSMLVGSCTGTTHQLDPAVGIFQTSPNTNQQVGYSATFAPTPTVAISAPGTNGAYGHAYDVCFLDSDGDGIVLEAW